MIARPLLLALSKVDPYFHAYEKCKNPFPKLILDPATKPLLTQLNEAYDDIRAKLGYGKYWSKLDKLNVPNGTTILYYIDISQNILITFPIELGQPVTFTYIHITWSWGNSNYGEISEVKYKYFTYDKSTKTFSLKNEAQDSC